MHVIAKSIHVLDYDNECTITRTIDDDFDGYIYHLIFQMDHIRNIREYRSRALTTQVVSSAIQVCKSVVQGNHKEIMVSLAEKIAVRLLEKELNVQAKIAHLGARVQKGSLIQALVYDEEKQSYKFLLAKVEHTNFVDDADFSFRTGFDRDHMNIWKFCIMDLSTVEIGFIDAKVYSGTSAKYWSDEFLELQEIRSDATNTKSAFTSIDFVLTRYMKKNWKKDYFNTRNNLLLYFRSNSFIDIEQLVDHLERYEPFEMGAEHYKAVMSEIRKLPEKKHFDFQFNCDMSAVKAKIRTVMDVTSGIRLQFTDGIENPEEKICAYQDDGDGKKYLRIETDNDETFESFVRT